MDFKNIFHWDGYSDQPHVIRDKKTRKAIKSTLYFASFKLFIINLFMAPVSLILFAILLLKKSSKKIDENFFAMSINLNKNPEITKPLIEELGVTTLLIRLPLSDMNNFNKYRAFIKEYKGYDILVNILQDREHVEDLELLEKNLHVIFKELLPFTCKFQIGNAINRKKWAFFSMDEYLKFYEVAQTLKQKHYPKLTLVGSAVIDFEYHYTLQTLFNFHKVHYDIFSSLLYVDRRGAPENTQMGLDLVKKIKLLYAMMLLSPKTANSLVITEANWPRSNTAPYAPTSELECVNDEDYSSFMVRYHLLAISTGMVKTIYWHQLIAPGYGLIDNRNGITKYRSFEAYKVMVTLLKDATFLEYNFNNDTHHMKLQSTQCIEIFWSDTVTVTPSKSSTTLSLYGETCSEGSFIYQIS